MKRLNCLGILLTSEPASRKLKILFQNYDTNTSGFLDKEQLECMIDDITIVACEFIPEGTINYLSNIGESTFIQVQGSEIRNKALWVMVTSRPEDNQLYQEFKQLAQTAIQNGASLYEVSQMYTDNSIRSIQNNLKDLKDKQDQQLAQEQQLRQQELEQQQQEAQALLEQQERHHQDTLDMKKYEIDTRANTELGKAQIQNYFKVPETDVNNNNIPDAMEIANHTLKLQESLAKRDLEQQNINLQYQKLKQDREEKAKDRELQKEKIKSDKQKAKQKPKK